MEHSTKNPIPNNVVRKSSNISSEQVGNASDSATLGLQSWLEKARDQQTSQKFDREILKIIDIENLPSSPHTTGYWKAEHICRGH